MKKLFLCFMLGFVSFFIFSCQNSVTEKTYQVTFEVDNVKTIKDIKENRLLSSIVPEDPIKEDWIFVNWFDLAGIEIDLSIRVSRNYYYVARFKQGLLGFDGYYQDISPSLRGEELKSALNTLISGHKMYTYDQTTNYFYYIDEEVGNPGYTHLLYGGSSAATTKPWNKEHVWPQSRGMNGSFGTSVGIGTDMHNIHPSINAINSERSNYNFDEGGVLTNAYPEYGNYVDTTLKTFEPRDEDKGDIARTLFYMDVRYEGLDGMDNLTIVEDAPTSGSYYGRIGRLSTLLRWHLEDPVDDQERQRNDRVFEYQKNRNPFIDFPELVYYIWDYDTTSVESEDVVLSFDNLYYQNDIVYYFMEDINEKNY